MFGAIYIGLSGLNAYSRGLQLVSNNVANLNTSGFKATTVSFQNYYGIGGGGGLSYLGSNGSGGGHGVGIGHSGTDFAQGQLQQTDSDLDLAVDGNGFLTLLDGDRMLYVRTGSFEVDPQGYIVLSGTDYRLATLDEGGKPTSISLDGYRTNVPKPTTVIKFADNLSSDVTADTTVNPNALPTVTVGNLTVHDPNGGAHVWTVKFQKDSTLGTSSWKVIVTDDKGTTLGKTGEDTTLGFIGGIVDPAKNKLTVTDTTNNFSVTLDFSSGVTSYSAGNVSTLRSASIDGYGQGTLSTATVNDKGKLELSYTNDQKQELGAIAIADFRDPDSLEQRDGGLFVQTGSATRQFLASEDPRVGKVVSKRLEASNVDLSREFGEMIMIQRGFQASSQIVSVSNDMIQQLFGIRGQG